MEEKNQEVLALAFKNARRKIEKINEFGIKPDLTKEETNAIIIKLTNAKLEDESNTKKEKDILHGQRWYVEDLAKFSGLDPQAQLDHEYAECFGDVAEEDDMVTELAKLSA